MSLISITVKSSKDRKDIAIEDNKSIKQFKEVAAKEFNVTYDQLCLIFAGKILRDNDTIKQSYLSEGTVVHLVIKSVNKTLEDGNLIKGFQNTSKANIDASPFQLGPLGGIPGLEEIGFGSANFIDLQQKMQKELLSNPEKMKSLFDNPLTQQVTNNPDLLKFLVSSNPQMNEIIQENPEIGQMMNDSTLLKQMMSLAKTPQIMREMIHPAYRDIVPNNKKKKRDDEDAVQNGIDPTPCKLPKLTHDNDVKSADSDIDKTNIISRATESALFQMIENPQTMSNILHATYVKSTIQFITQNPDVFKMMLRNVEGVSENPQLLTQLEQSMPYLLQQMNNPEIQNLITNPRALQAILDIQQGMAELQSEVPGFIGFGSAASTPNDMLLRALNTVTNQDKPEEEKFSHQLNQLKTMGFDDEFVNLQVLSSNSGDVNLATEQLMQQ